MEGGSASWRARGRRLLAWVGRPWNSRATLSYFLILVSNRIVLASLSGLSNRRGQVLGLDTLVLRAVSTNLSRLRHDPFNVLISSAFFVQSVWEVVVFGVAAVLVLAPLERRIGTRRWVTGFAAGHVGATVIVAAGLALAVNTHRVVPNTARTIDVGMSYGTAALLGVAALCLTIDSRRRRAAAAGSLVVITAIGLAVGQTYTDWGHVTAVIIGLVLGVLFASRMPAPRAPTTAT